MGHQQGVAIALKGEAVGVLFAIQNNVAKDVEGKIPYGDEQGHEMDKYNTMHVQIYGRIRFCVSPGS